MMQKIILVVTIFTLGCVNNAKVIHTDKQIPSFELYKLVKCYDPSLELHYYGKGEKYPLGDSLDVLCANLNPNSILDDTTYRKAILFFLEKKYLYLVKLNKHKSNVFYIYNASCWKHNDFAYSRFALNIFSKVKKDTTRDYNYYIAGRMDLICVDSIILEASTYQLEDEHRKIHQLCLGYLPSNCMDF